MYFKYATMPEVKDLPLFDSIRVELGLPPDPVKLEGWTTGDKGVELAKLILKEKPKVVVELGVFGGRSLIAMAMALRAAGGGKAFGIDPWRLQVAIEGETDTANIQWWTNNINLHEIHRGAMEAIWRLGLDQWAIIIRAASQDVLQLFPMIEVLHIDANHSELASCRDVENFVPRVPSGKWVIFDDSDWGSTRKAVALLNGYCELVKDYGSWRLYQRR